MVLQGYENGACKEGEEIDVTYKVERREMDISEFIAMVFESEVARKAALERFWENGVFGMLTADRYDDGRLDDLLWDSQYVQRIMYRTFTVDIPAGESINIAANYIHNLGWGFMEDSMDVSEYYLRFSTGLGSSLNILSHTLSVKAGEGVVYYEGGLMPDPSGRAELDPDTEDQRLIFKF